MTRALRAMRTAYGLPQVSYDPGKNPGPVSEAIRTMRAADPAFDLNPELRALRRALADRIDADIAVLDMLGGDPDLEPSLGSGDDREEDAGDEPEEENEHGGDIQDEPHDEDPDREPSLCGVTANAVNVGNYFLDGEQDDGDAPEATSLETFGAGFRGPAGDDGDEDGHDAEGGTDDNGIADAPGAWDQGFPHYGGCYWPSTGDLLGEARS